MDLFNYIYRIGGQFTFPTNQLVKDQQYLSGNKKDMRRKQIPGFSTTKRIRKGQEGIKFNLFNPIQLKELNYDFSTLPNYNSAVFEEDPLSEVKSLNDIVLEVVPKQEPQIQIPYNTPIKHKSTMTTKKEDYSKYVGFNGFNKAYDEVEKEMPEARLFRGFLTKIASHESGFNAKVLNKQGAPAYGYFLFMQDGKKWNNITKYSGLTIEEFRNNPKELIKAAIKLAKAFMRSFNQEDLNKAKELGISMSGLLGGAWLGGAGGVKKALNGIDTSDKHWSKDGKTGSSVIECFKRYNNL